MAVNSGAVNVGAINGTADPVSTAAITGRWAESVASISGVPTYDGIVTGGAFSTSVGIYGGGIAFGTGFSCTPSITVNSTFDGYVTGRGFDTGVGISALGIELANITGRSFSATSGIYGGAIVLARGFNSTASMAVDSNATASISGGAFSTVAEIVAISPASVTITGGAFNTVLFYCSARGSSFTTEPIITAEYTTAYAEAYVMNIRSNQVSRYQNFPFSHITRINGAYYGVKSDGLYLLSGNYDSGVKVNGTIWSPDMDLGSFHSKNTPYLYVNGDDTYTVTAYVDSVQQPAFISGFSGRRVKLARGNKGRYWSFKLEGVSKLQGIEFLPDELSRRVK